MGLFTHIGTFLLLAATALLIVASISAPVVDNIAMLKVELANKDVYSFGTFGYCLMGQDSTDCTRAALGYNPIRLLESANSADYGSAADATVRALTTVQVLHPVGAALAFIAFLAALGHSVVGALIASALSFLAWLVVLIVMVTDFVAWGIVKDKVNGNDSNGYARFDTAMWCVLAAMVALFFATFVVLFTCCSQRRSGRAERTRHVKTDPAYGNGTTHTTHTRTKRHFWQRRERY